MIHVFSCEASVKECEAIKGEDEMFYDCMFILAGVCGVVLVWPRVARDLSSLLARHGEYLPMFYKMLWVGLVVYYNGMRKTTLLHYKEDLVRQLLATEDSCSVGSYRPLPKPPLPAPKWNNSIAGGDNEL